MTVLKELFDLKNEVSDLKLEVSKLREDIQQLIITCGRMDNHISFVESVWTVVKNPFSQALQFYYGDNKSIKKLESLNVKSITN